MNIKEAKILQQAGVLETPSTKQHNNGDGWEIRLNGTHKLNPLLETARGQVRVFKRLDSVANIMFEIGFEEIKINR